MGPTVLKTVMYADNQPARKAELEDGIRWVM